MRSSSDSELLRIESVSKSFGRVAALAHVDLTIGENEFFVLLGPSGSGKTTLLRIIAGFEMPDSGRIMLGGSDITWSKPYRRPLNTMFQSYALFPHMTVTQNVAYGLEAEKRPRDEIVQRVVETLSTVKLNGLEDRRPAQLSGGQRQRVALARALVKRPRVLLLDEPLSSLDRNLRQEMQVELKRLQHSVGITFLVVTHDQEEALALADRIAVMRSGRVEQVGSPEALYEHPETAFAARFLGESNLFTGELDAKTGLVLVPGLLRPLVPPADLPRPPAGPVTLLVRPEQLDLQPAGSPVLEGVNAVRGVVAQIAYAGSARKVIVDVEGRDPVIVRFGPKHVSAGIEVGCDVDIVWRAAVGVLIVPRTDEAEDGARETLAQRAFERSSQ